MTSWSGDSVLLSVRSGNRLRLRYCRLLPAFLHPCLLCPPLVSLWSHSFWSSLSAPSYFLAVLNATSCPSPT